MTSGTYSPADDPLLTKRTVIIGTAIDDQSAQLTIAKLLFLNMQDGKSPISLRIDSPGGSVTSSLAIIGTITDIAAPVHTHAIHRCNGTALLLLAVGLAGTRRATEHTHLSIEPTELHSADSTEQAQFHLAKLNSNMAEILSAHTQLTKEEAHEALIKGKHFTVEQALSAGVIDVIDPLPREDATE
jgi:ATP-dependent Clp protease protease subunit